MLLEGHVFALLVAVPEVGLTLVDLVVLLHSLAMIELARARTLDSSIVALTEVLVGLVVLLASLLGKHSVEFNVAIVHHKVF